MNNSSLIQKSQSNGITITSTEATRRSGVIYRASGNLVVIRETQKTVPHQFVGSSRGVISEFSPSAGVRMRRYLRECLSEYKQMVTLTYPGFYPGNGAVCKEHLRRFLQELQREHSRCHQATQKGHHSSFWFLEFQQRGAPHFHIFTTWAPDKDWVAKRWYEIVGSEDIRHLHAGTRTEFLRSGRAGTISYAAKYAAKLEQKAVPENFENVGRFWGVMGRRGTVAATAFVNRTADDVRMSEKAINMFYRYINNMIFRGEGEVLVREKGIMVLNVYDYREQVQVRGMVARISCSVQRFDNMFCDAELDFGSDY